MTLSDLITANKEWIGGIYIKVYQHAKEPEFLSVSRANLKYGTYEVFEFDTYSVFLKPQV